MMESSGTPPLRVLFLCTQNSARSQIAEALLQRKGRGRFETASAGTEPAIRVNSMAVRVLAEHGIDWGAARPKAVAAVQHEPWDMVITVCDRALETCPTFPSRPISAHWGIEDPAAAEGGEEAVHQAFRNALSYLSRRIDLMLALPIEALQRKAAEDRMRWIGRTDGASTGCTSTTNPTSTPRARSAAHSVSASAPTSLPWREPI